MRAAIVIKSLLLGLVGAGLFAFFFMMGVIPALAVMARLSGNIAQSSVVVDPARVMRLYGLPLAGIAFITCFVLSMRRFRRPPSTNAAEVVR